MNILQLPFTLSAHSLNFIQHLLNLFSMNAFLYCSLLMLLSCHEAKQPEPTPVTDNSLQTDTAARAFYATEDSVTIFDTVDDSIAYTKQAFNNIIDQYPELVSKDIYHPDITYNGLRKKGVRFSSESGQDEYYTLYAYFLNKRNDDTIFAARRNQLIQTYELINSLFQKLQGGGTYFGHQLSRIQAYVAYDIYQLRWSNQPSKKDISKQKALFIQSLRQIITDTYNGSNAIATSVLPEHLKKLTAIVDQIAMNITDLWYLRKVQQFLYRYYSYTG